MFRKSVYVTPKPTPELIGLIQESWDRVRLLEIDENKIILNVLDRSLFKGLDTIGLFTIKFYDNLFHRYPNFKGYFTDVDKQARGFTGMLDVVLKKIENLDAYEDKIRELGRKHTEKLKVKPEMYSHLVAVLVLTIKEFLKDDFVTDYQHAWATCFHPIIEMMVEGPKPKKILNKKIRDANFEQIDFMQNSWNELLALELDSSSINIKTVEQQVLLAMRLMSSKPDAKTLICIKFYDVLFAKESSFKPVFNDYQKQYQLFSDLIDCTLNKSDNFQDNEDHIKKIGHKYFETYKMRPSTFDTYVEVVIATFQDLLGNKLSEEARKAWRAHLKTTLLLLLSERSKPATLSKQHNSNKESLSVEDTDILRKSWELVKILKIEFKFRFKCIDIRNIYSEFEAQEKHISNTELFLLRFYDTLFYDNPSLRMHFPTEQVQRRAFLAMINAVLFNSEHNPQNEKKFKEHGVHHFKLLRIPAEALTKFTDSIYRTLAEFLTDKNTEHVQRCWKTAFNIVITMMTAETKQRQSMIEVESGLSEEQVILIRKSWETLLKKTVSINSLRLRRLSQELLQSKGDEPLTTQTVFCIKFYDNLFWEHSELQAIFNSAKMQSTAFTGLMFTLVEKIEYLDQYEEKIRELGKKHSERYGIKPDYYQYLTTSLISTLKEFLQEDFDVEIRNAWREAFDQITMMMIDGPLKKDKKFSETSSSGTVFKAMRRNKMTPLQVSLIQKTWLKLETKKPDLSRIQFKFVDRDIINEASNPTTVFSLVFYDILFQIDAKLQIVFPNIFTKSRAFGGMMKIMVNKIEFLDENEEKIRDLGKKHLTEYKISPEMFENVHSAVIKSLKFMLEDELDSETLDAWNDAFNIVIEYMIEGPKKSKKKLIEEDRGMMSQKNSVDNFKTIDREHKELKDFKP